LVYIYLVFLIPSFFLFWLGIDKPDIIFVIHSDVSASLEAFYQVFFFLIEGKIHSFFFFVGKWVCWP
jgi:hypothetical protein